MLKMLQYPPSHELAFMRSSPNLGVCPVQSLAPPCPSPPPSPPKKHYHSYYLLERTCIHKQKICTGATTLDHIFSTHICRNISQLSHKALQSIFSTKAHMLNQKYFNYIHPWYTGGTTHLSKKRGQIEKKNNVKY